MNLDGAVVSSSNRVDCLEFPNINHYLNRIDSLESWARTSQLMQSYGYLLDSDRKEIGR
jgi:hypothetical protein